METIKCKTCGKELPEENFKRTAWGGRAHVCNACVQIKYKEGRAKKKQQEAAQGLESYSPRELMIELAKRGYTGTLRFTQVHNIDITKVD